MRYSCVVVVHDDDGGGQYTRIRFNLPTIIHVEMLMKRNKERKLVIG